VKLILEHSKAWMGRKLHVSADLHQSKNRKVPDMCKTEPV